MTLSADESRFLFGILGKEFEFRVVEFTVLERMSFSYEVGLSLASEEEIDFRDAIGMEGLLTILGEETDRYCHGIVNRFRQTGVGGRFYLYEASMVPPLWELLSLEHDCRIHQNKSAGDEKTVADIVAEVLEEGRISSDSFDFRLLQAAQYKPREFCVQYRETDLNFISRLLEDEGIFYFFEHARDRLLLVFGDSVVNYRPIPGETELPFNPASGMETDESFVYEFSYSKQIHTGKVYLRDFSFIKPSLPIFGRKQDGPYHNLELYDYDGRHPDTKDWEMREIERSAQVRLEEEMALKERVEGRSSCHRFTPGHTFQLIDHEMDGFNREYLLVEVLHSGSQPQVLEELASSGMGTQYSNQFVAIPSSVIFRPERRTRRPVVEGLQTAIVAGPTDEEIYTDEDGYGRVKVKFHWDRRELEGEEKRSCWLRVGQFWAGQGRGSVFIPRVGDEVLVHFLEGDPDQPIVVGSVYNEANRPLYELPDEKTKSTVKTKSYPHDSGYNEIRFEDKKGEEQLFIHAQKDMSEVVENNQSISVGTDQSVTVGNNRTTTVQKGDDKLTVEMGDRIVTIDTGDHTLTVKTGDRTTNVKTGDDKHTVKSGDRMVTIDTGDDKLDVKMGQRTATVKGPYEITVKSQHFKIICGKSQLILNHSGLIEIKGADLNIKGTSDVKIKGNNIESNAEISNNTKGAQVLSEAKAMNVIKGGMVQLNP